MLKTANDYLKLCSNPGVTRGDKNYCLGFINALANAFEKNYVNGIDDLFLNNPEELVNHKEYVICQNKIHNILNSTVNSIPNFILMKYYIRYISSNSNEQKNLASGAFDDLMVKSFNGALALYPEQCTPGMTIEQREQQKKIISVKNKTDKVIP